MSSLKLLLTFSRIAISDLMSKFFVVKFNSRSHSFSNATHIPSRHLEVVCYLLLSAERRTLSKYFSKMLMLRHPRYLLFAADSFSYRDHSVAAGDVLHNACRIPHFDYASREKAQPNFSHVPSPQRHHRRLLYSFHCARLF